MDPETEDRVNFFKKVWEQDRRSGGHLFGRWEKCNACGGLSGGELEDGSWQECTACGGVGSVEVAS